MACSFLTGAVSFGQSTKLLSATPAFSDAIVGRPGMHRGAGTWGAITGPAARADIVLVMAEVGECLGLVWTPLGSPKGDAPGYGMRELARQALVEVDLGKVAALFDDLFKEAAADGDTWRHDMDALPIDWGKLVQKAHVKLESLGREQEADDSYQRNRAHCCARRLRACLLC